MGAQLRVYRQKIKSAQTTKKITRAMELIAASRIQKAKARVEATSPYTNAITRAVSAVATHSNFDHPLLTEPETITRAAVVIFTSDRGLAGAFNSQVLREAEELSELLRSEGKAVTYYLIGRKAQGYFKFRNRASERIWSGGTESPVFPPVSIRQHRFLSPPRHANRKSTLCRDRQNILKTPCRTSKSAWANWRTKNSAAGKIISAGKTGGAADLPYRPFV